MITCFDDAFNFLIGVEKGYTVDNGGPTMYGVTEAVARANGYQGDMHDLPFDTAKAIAKSEYWDKYHCSQFDPSIGYLVFDAAYNGGHPVVWLQRAAEVAQDGILGAATVAAVRATDPWRIRDRFNAYHAEYYAALKDYTYIDGWVNRIARNLLIGASNG